MSLDDLWSKIPKAELSSDQPDEFTAMVTKVKTGVNKQGGNVIILTLKKTDGVEFSTNFNIPKAWTGKGQADLLKEQLGKLGLAGPLELLDKVFRWRRMELSGSMKGFPRHYPVALIKGKIT